MKFEWPSDGRGAKRAVSTQVPNNRHVAGRPARADPLLHPAPLGPPAAAATG